MSGISLPIPDTSPLLAFVAPFRPTRRLTALWAFVSFFFHRLPLLLALVLIADTGVRMVVLNALLVTFLMLHIVLRPYRTNLLLVMEYVSLGALMVLVDVLSASGWAAEVANSSANLDDGPSLLLIILTVALLLVIWLFDQLRLNSRARVAAVERS
jgi:hypothetical protein